MAGLLTDEFGSDFDRAIADDEVAAIVAVEFIDEAGALDELIVAWGFGLFFHGVGFRLNYAFIIAKSLRFVKRVERMGNDVII